MSLPPIADQQSFWNHWNAEYREGHDLDAASIARRDAVLERMTSLSLEKPRILEIGCGSGWLSAALAKLGSVVAVDLADEVIERARATISDVEFLAGDVFQIDLEKESFDVVICLETLSHVRDQTAFLRRLRDWMRPGGHVILTTQNQFVMARMNVHERGSGQIRQWVTPRQLRGLLRAAELAVVHITTISPGGWGGVLRLVNGRKINRIMSLIVSQQRLNRLKERVGLGQTIVAVARKGYGGRGVGR